VKDEPLGKPDGTKTRTHAPRSAPLMPPSDRGMVGGMGFRDQSQPTNNRPGHSFCYRSRKKVFPYGRIKILTL
jgi:hypothetical protein